MMLTAPVQGLLRELDVANILLLNLSITTIGICNLFHCVSRPESQQTRRGRFSGSLVARFPLTKPPEGNLGFRPKGIDPCWSPLADQTLAGWSSPLSTPNPASTLMTDPSSVSPHNHIENLPNRSVTRIPVRPAPTPTPTPTPTRTHLINHNTA